MVNLDLRRASHRRYYWKNREKRLEINRKYKSKDPIKWRRLQRESYHRRKKDVSLRLRDQRISTKKSIIDFYGGSCIRCGFTDWRALQIDHINGGGHKELEIRSSNQIYKMIINGKLRKGDYQLLCANCNWIKRFESNELFNRNLK